MFQIKRGCAIGGYGNNETDFEATINFFKNDAGCVEVSRTGQAEDKSLAVELKYRDFPNFSLKMINSTSKSFVVKFGGNLKLNIYFLYNAHQRVCDLILSDQFIFVLTFDKIFGIAKDNFGDFLMFSDENYLCTSSAGKYESTRVSNLLSQCFSANGKVLILDIFCPDFSITADGKTLDFERKLIGVKNIVGLNSLARFSQFSIDGQEYVRITDRLCVEVTP